MVSLKNVPCSIKFVKYQNIAHVHMTSIVNHTIQMSYTGFDTSKAIAPIPPLIIMHGLFGSKTNWNSLSKALLKQLNPPRGIITVDARNHGNSKHTETHTYNDLVEDIRFFMSTLQIERASFIGHSMGGRAVMLCALKYVLIILVATVFLPIYNLLVA